MVALLEHLQRNDDCLSQVLFNQILNNRAYFPGEGPFFLYIIIAFQIIPFLAILDVESLLENWLGPESL